MAGKGDTPRPVDFKKYQENYDFIFDNKEEDFLLGHIVQNGCLENTNEGCNIQTTTGQS
jgi:hypothetical protein